MGNSLLNSSIIAKEGLMQFKNNLGFTAGVNRQYDDQFAKSGAKIGNTINIRVPQRFEAKSGAAVQLQSVINQTKPLVLDQREHVAFEFDTQELTLNIEKFSENYIQPAVLALANKVDVTGLKMASRIANSVGTPGSTPTSTDIAGDALQKLQESACPDGHRHMVVNPKAMNKIVAGSKSLFQSSEQIAEQYEKGVMGIAGGFKWRGVQNIMSHKVGPLGGAPKVNVAGQSGNSINTKGWTAAAANRLKKGDVVTFDDVYALNPLTYESTGELKQFVLTEDFDSDGGGNGAIKISPAIVLTGTTRNVDAAPADNADVNVLGAAGTVTPLNLAYHKDAFVLGCADLYIPNNVEMASVARDKDSGLSVRFVRYYDGDNDRLISRFDILFGWMIAHEDWAVRVHG